MDFQVFHIIFSELWYIAMLVTLVIVRSIHFDCRLTHEHFFLIIVSNRRGVVLSAVTRWLHWRQSRCCPRNSESATVAYYSKSNGLLLLILSFSHRCWSCPLHLSFLCLSFRAVLVAALSSSIQAPSLKPSYPKLLRSSTSAVY